MSEKLCVKCQAAPAYVGPTRTYAYCQPCDSERRKADYLANHEAAKAAQRERTARYRANTAPRTCPRCGTSHTSGGSDNWCKDCRAAYHRARRADPVKRARIQERQRDWYQANRDYSLAQHRAYRSAIRREAIDAYGGTCACCGEHRIEFLAIHHIKGNGKQHRKLASGVGDQFFRWLKRQGWPQDVPLGVLCHNCNMSHGFYGYCPHERERADSDN